MIISCVICKDLFSRDSTILATGCGHMYHENCIMQWLSQKKTCPHCRTSLNTSLIRIYLLEEETERTSLSVEELEEKLSNVQLLLMRSEATIKSHKLSLDVLNTELANLTKENRTLKSEAEVSKKTCLSLKCEIKRLAKCESDLNDFKKIHDELVNKHSLCTKIQELISLSASDAALRLKNTPRTSIAWTEMCTIVEVFKKQANDANNRCRKLVNEKHHFIAEIDRLKEQLASKKKDNETVSKDLEITAVNNISLSCVEPKKIPTFSNMSMVTASKLSSNKLKKGPSKEILNGSKCYDGMGGTSKNSFGISFSNIQSFAPKVIPKKTTPDAPKKRPLVNSNISTFIVKKSRP